MYILWCVVFFFFKQKTADEMRISDWSSDVCSSDLRSRKAPGRADSGRADGRRTCSSSRLARHDKMSGHNGPSGRPAPSSPSGARWTGRGPATPIGKIGRAHVCTPVTDSHLVCRLMVVKNNTVTPYTTLHRFLSV